LGGKGEGTYAVDALFRYIAHLFAIGTTEVNILKTLPVSACDINRMPLIHDTPLIANTCKPNAERVETPSSLTHSQNCPRGAHLKQQYTGSRSYPSLPPFQNRYSQSTDRARRWKDLQHAWGVPFRFLGALALITWGIMDIF